MLGDPLHRSIIIIENRTKKEMTKLELELED